MTEPKDLAVPSAVVPFGPPQGTEIEVFMKWGDKIWQITRGRVLEVSLDFLRSDGSRWGLGEEQGDFTESRIEKLSITLENTEVG